MNNKTLFDTATAWFSSKYPQPETELDYVDLYELTVAVILSAQCTDKRVNIITKEFFRKLPDFKALATAKADEVFGLIKSCSYPNNKTKNLQAMSQKVVADFKGVMPSDVDLLQTIPGIGRKSANVIAAVGFRQNTMPVDTHVFRVAQRIGFVSKSKTPTEVEKKLLQVIPADMLRDYHHWLILHGRYVCQARKPKCAECGITTVCNYFHTIS
jgi:endonuclease-3